MRSEMMDGSERQRRSHKDELKLTTKELQVDCFNHAAKEVAFCITYCGFILLYTQIMDILYHIGLAENWNAVKKQKRYSFLQAPRGRSFEARHFHRDARTGNSYSIFLSDLAF